jgi:DNA replication protein DnaC
MEGFRMKKLISEFMKEFIKNHPEFRIEGVVERHCEKHGDYQNYRLVRTYPDGSESEFPLLGCPGCRDEECIQEGIEMMKDSSTGNRIAEIGIPQNFAYCTVKGFTTTDADKNYEMRKKDVKNHVVQFVNGDTISLVLLGKTGTGKTHLMIAALKALTREGKSALYTTERKIYREIHESYQGRRDLPSESQIIDKYSNVDVLGIDEIGRSSWTEHESQTLYEIIDNRSMNCKQTIMAGNIGPEDYEKKFDESFRRKLYTEPLLCAWKRRTN